MRPYWEIQGQVEEGGPWIGLYQYRGQQMAKAIFGAILNSEGGAGTQYERDELDMFEDFRLVPPDTQPEHPATTPPVEEEPPAVTKTRRKRLRA